jgi:ATP-dependent metalloprotease FtsH
VSLPADAPSDQTAEKGTSSTPPPTPHPSGFRVDPAPDGRGAPPQQKPPFIPRNRTFIWLLVGLLAINVLVAVLANAPTSRPQVPYQPFFVEQVEADNVREISSTSDSIEGSLKKEATYTPPDGGDAVKVSQDFKTEVPSFIDNKAVTELLTEHHVVINASAPSSGGSTLLTILFAFLPTTRIPHGVLLYGPPGTGKTLLARAVAGQAHAAAYFHISASEFVEAIVGVGASRVRDLFKQAKEAAPAIVFIDELDAIGRSRSGNVGGLSGGNDEREQTLNQILTEMDGFEPGTDVIVLGATNRPEILDPALLRPGRFDRRIAVNPPDRNGRVAILGIHTRDVALADDVDLERIAASIPGSTGADIALLVNEAALFAARREHAKVEQRDFTDAIEKILLGAERQVVMSDADRRRTAYHESGHALVGMLTPGADPVRKISIIPRGQALGVTLSTPDSDRYNYRREDLVAKIKVALGGRAAEKVVFDEISTGAESDIQNLTQVARGMVGRWGMSDAIGPIAVTDARQDGMLLPGAMPASEPTQELVDREVRRIVDEAEDEVIELLQRERDRLEALAAALLERETLDQPEAYEIAGVPLVAA